MRNLNHKIAIVLAFVLFSNGFYAQNAQLSVNLSKPDGKPASGIVQISGTDTTIIDNSFVSPKIYIIKSIIGLEEQKSFSEQFKCWPNPTYDGNLNLTITFNGKPSGIFSIFEANGREIGQIKAGESGYSTFDASEGIVLLNYLDGTKKHTIKIINNSKRLNININHEIPTEAKREKSVLGADDFAFSYTDPIVNIENHTENFSLTPGNTYTINKTLDWTNKALKSQGTTNKNTKLEVKDANTGDLLYETNTTNGIILLQTFNNRFDNTVGKDLEYLLTGAYTDPASLLIKQFANETFNFDTIRLAHFNVNVTGNGATYKIEEQNITANVGTESFFKVPSDKYSFSVLVEKPGYESKRVPVNNMPKGDTTINVTLNLAAYNHALNIQANSSITDKLIENGTKIYVIKDFTSNPTDTTWVTTLNELANVSWGDNKQTDTTKVGAKILGGHLSNEIQFTMDDSETRTITFTGINYSLVVTLNIKDQDGGNVANANITGGDVPKITDPSGVAIITKSNLPTDPFNKPSSTYPVPLSITGTDIDPKNLNLNLHINDNGLLTETVTKYFDQFLRGQLNVPNALVRVWKGGLVEQSGTSQSNGSYTTSIKKRSAPFTSDSVTISLTNYQTIKYNGFVLHKGGDQLNATLIALYSVFGTTSTPTASIAGWDDGVQKFSVTTNTSGAYNTPSFTASGGNLDSIIATKPGFERIKRTNVPLNVGGNDIEFNLLRFIIRYVYGDNTTPPGTTVTVYNNGQPIATGTVGADNKYRTTDIINTTSDPFTVDSMCYLKLDGPEGKWAPQTKKNVALVEGGNRQEATLPQIPEAEHNFRIKTYKLNGDLAPGLQLRFKWADGTTTDYTSDANGFIHVQRTEYSNPTINAEVTRLSPNYNFFMMFKKEDWTPADTNYSQPSKFDGIEHPAILNLANIPLDEKLDTVELYLPLTQYPTPPNLVAKYGPNMNFNHNDIRDAMGGRNTDLENKYKTLKFVTTPSLPIEIVQFAFYYTVGQPPGAPVSTIRLDEAKTELDKILNNIFTLSNGKTLLYHNQFARINNFSEAPWPDVAARGGARTFYQYFTLAAPTSSNGVVPYYDNSPNGEEVIKTANAEDLRDETLGSIFEENYEAFFNLNDVAIEGMDLAYSLSGPTSLGTAVGQFIYHANPGTITKEITK